MDALPVAISSGVSFDDALLIAERCFGELGRKTIFLWQRYNEEYFSGSLEVTPVLYVPVWSLDWPASCRSEHLPDASRSLASMVPRAGRASPRDDPPKLVAVRKRRTPCGRAVVPRDHADFDALRQEDLGGKVHGPKRATREHGAAVSDECADPEPTRNSKLATLHQYRTARQRVATRRK